MDLLDDNKTLVPLPFHRTVHHTKVLLSSAFVKFPKIKTPKVVHINVTATKIMVF